MVVSFVAGEDEEVAWFALSSRAGTAGREMCWTADDEEELQRGTVELVCGCVPCVVDRFFFFLAGKKDSMAVSGIIMFCAVWNAFEVRRKGGFYSR